MTDEYTEIYKSILHKIKTYFMNKDKFIEKARKIHGEKYDYSNVMYNHNFTFL